MTTVSVSKTVPENQWPAAALHKEIDGAVTDGMATLTLTGVTFEEMKKMALMVCLAEAWPAGNA
jgi:hypothetical protein